jgi:hypothetical protein
MLFLCNRKLGCELCLSDPGPPFTISGCLEAEFSIDQLRDYKFCKEDRVLFSQSLCHLVSERNLYNIIHM